MWNQTWRPVTVIVTEAKWDRSKEKRYNLHNSTWRILCALYRWFGKETIRSVRIGTRIYVDADRGIYMWGNLKHRTARFRDHQTVEMSKHIGNISTSFRWKNECNCQTWGILYWGIPGLLEYYDDDYVPSWSLYTPSLPQRTCNQKNWILFIGVKLSCEQHIIRITNISELWILFHT